MKLLRCVHQPGGRSEWVWVNGVIEKSYDGVVEVRAQPGKGFGVFAMRAFEVGERVISEPPLACWHVLPGEAQSSAVRRLAAIIEGLSEVARQTFLALSQNEEVHGESKSLLGVWLTNALPVSAEGEPPAVVGAAEEVSREGFEPPAFVLYALWKARFFCI